MSALNQAQVADCAAQAASHLFGGITHIIGGATSATIGVNWTDIQTNVTALDAALDTTINAAQAGGFGSQTVINALAAQLSAPVSSWTAQQKYVLLMFVLAKRAGLL